MTGSINIDRHKRKNKLKTGGHRIEYTKQYMYNCRRFHTDYYKELDYFLCLYAFKMAQVFSYSIY